MLTLLSLIYPDAAKPPLTTIEDRAARATAMKWHPPAQVMQFYVPRLAPLAGTLAVGQVAFPIIECRRIESGFFA